MNQDTTTPQPHPWVTTSTPDNLRNPQLLQDLSEIGMTCLLGWHALMDTPHSYAAESVWYGKAKTWAEELISFSSFFFLAASSCHCFRAASAFLKASACL